MEIGEDKQYVLSDSSPFVPIQNVQVRLCFIGAVVFLVLAVFVKLSWSRYGSLISSYRSSEHGDSIIYTPKTKELEKRICRPKSIEDMQTLVDLR